MSDTVKQMKEHVAKINHYIGALGGPSNIGELLQAKSIALAALLAYEKETITNEKD